MPDDLDKPTLRERMEQASLLPEHDPVRAKLLHDIAAADKENDTTTDHMQGPAGREWLQLSEETERLKLALSSVPVAAGLEAKWLAIPDTVSSETPGNRSHAGWFTFRRLAVAASLLLLIAAGWMAYVGVSNYRERRAIEHVAALAFDLHKTLAAGPAAEQITTSDPKQAQAWLKARLNFPPIMLSAVNTKLTSAGVVRLGDAPAALTRWEKEGHTYTLLEFVPASLGLPGDFPQQTTEDPSTAPGQLKTVLWAEPRRGCGWALVMDKNASNTFNY